MLNLILVACSGVDDSVAPSGTADIVLADANNYAFAGSLDIPSVPVQAQTDLTLDWSAAVDDIQCHALDPAVDVDMVSLLLFRDLSEQEVEIKIAADELAMADVALYLSWENTLEQTTAPLSALTLFGQDADVETQTGEGVGTWMLGFAMGTTPGVGMRAIQFIEPLAAETNTDVVVGPACGMLTFDANLQDLDTFVTTTIGPWTVDWSALTLDSRGGDLVTSDIDSVMVARYEGETPEDLEARFLDIEIENDGMWTLATDGETNASLDGLADASGAAFPGFDTEATWILALRCSRCANPAPIFLTILEFAD